jgi:hypothetical protein
VEARLFGPFHSGSLESGYEKSRRARISSVEKPGISTPSPQTGASKLPSLQWIRATRGGTSRAGTPGRSPRVCFDSAESSRDSTEVTASIAGQRAHPSPALGGAPRFHRLHEFGVLVPRSRRSYAQENLECPNQFGENRGISRPSPRAKASKFPSLRGIRATSSIRHERCTSFFRGARDLPFWALAGRGAGWTLSTSSSW